MSARGYTISVLAALAVIIAGVGLFNYWVDPLLLFARQGGGPEQLSRIDQFPNMRFYKPHHVRKLSPAVLVIGSSRTGGIDPEHPGHPEKPAYNLSMPGITLFETYRSIRHVHSNKNIEHLIVGLDFDAMLSSNPQYRPGFSPLRMQSEQARVPVKQYFRDLQASLFSFQALGDSLTAMLDKGPGNRLYFRDGSWRATSNRLTGRGGYLYVAGNTGGAARRANFDFQATFRQLEQLLDYCYRSGIDTTLFLTPVHVVFVDLWYQLASENVWRETHRRIAELNEHLAQQYHRAPFPLWGFGAQPGVVDEPIPRQRDIDSAWFNDGVHFRPKTAGAIRDTLFGNRPGFGTALSSSNINAYLNEIDSLRKQFVEGDTTFTTKFRQAYQPTDD